MHRFLVELSSDRPHSPPLHPALFIDEPGVKIGPPTSDTSSPKVAKQTERLLALKEFQKCYVSAQTDAEKHQMMDMMCGKRRVPTVQFYDIGDSIHFNDDILQAIENIFYDSQSQVAGVVRIEQGSHCCVLRVEKAHVRRLSITINGLVCPLIRVHHRAQGEYKLDFPLARKPAL